MPNKLSGLGLGPRSRFIAFVLVLVVSLTTYATALPQSGRRIVGIVQKVEWKERHAEISRLETTLPLNFTWTRRTVFLANGRTVGPEILKRGNSVKLIYHEPFFGPPYVSRVTFLAGRAQPSRK